MRQVSSPTTTANRPGQRLRPWLRVLLAGSLVFGLVATTGSAAMADDLQDQRAKVRKALAKTKSSISDAKEDVAAASANLADSEKELQKARDELAYTQEKLAKAKERDAEIAAELKKARAALEKATAEVEQGEADIAAQQSLIGSVARTAYQQQTNLVSVGILLGADSVTQVADRLQWTDLIFGNTAAEMERLEFLQLKLQAAQAAREEAEAEVAEKRRESKAQVAEVKKLASQAAEHASRVESLVARNRQLRDTAQNELEVSREEYEKLEAMDAKITKKILAEMAKNKVPLVNKKGFLRPVNASPGSPFGMRYHPILNYWRMHWGLDFGAKCGAPLYAMADGKVTQVLKTAQSNGLGNWTVISYGTYKGDHIASGYAHQSKIIVKPGQFVAQGQVVGYVGTTGLSTGCHLHLQIYRNGARVNPINYV